MANFLLVHGAWHGAWCWQRVLPGLVLAGHRAHAVTLTGVGERAHLLHPGIDLDTHIQDVTAAMDAEELDEVVLVVHSAPLLRSRLWLLRPPLPERLEMKPPSFTPATRNTKRASSR